MYNLKKYILDLYKIGQKQQKKRENEKFLKFE